MPANPEPDIATSQQSRDVARRHLDGVKATARTGLLSRPVSQMSGYGNIFSDGIEADFLEFNAGITATISLSDRFGQLVQ